MNCAESLRVQAYFDGEMDAISAVEVERHAGRCAECQTLLHDLDALRRAIQRQIPRERAAPELRDRILRALDSQPSLEKKRTPRFAGAPWRTRAFWIGALGGAAGAAIAAAACFVMLVPMLGSALPEELLSAHVRSLMPEHLIDVRSTDQHTVKPWLAAHADLSPVVSDFASQGFRLIGGRTDYVDRQRAAVIVYQHGAHIINVFAWVSTGAAPLRSVDRNGYHMVFWRSGGLNYCAVSDTSLRDLSMLEGLLQGASASGQVSPH